MHDIANLTAHVVLLRLNSGLEINVAPGQRLKGVAGSEVRANAVLEKLVRLGAIAVTEGVAEARAGKGGAEPTERDRGEKHRNRR